MNNMLTYLRFRKDISFKQSPINTVDMMILDILVSLDFTDVLEGEMEIGEVAARYKEEATRDLRDDRLKDKEELLLMMADSKRFGKIRLSNFVKNIDKKAETTFYALTVHISKFEKLVAFRGTDGNLLSWKENFNSLYQMPTPGQSAALDYLEAAFDKPFVKVNVSGHSKGGNLALYSAMFLNEKSKKRLKRVYIYDGPGFYKKVSDTPEFMSISDKIEGVVPEYCVVGNMMTPGYNRYPVKSSVEATYQHDLFTWEVCADGFDKAEKISDDAIRLSNTVNEWIESMPVANRKKTVDELFDVFEKNGILHSDDLFHIDLKHMLKMLRSATNLSADNKRLMAILVKEVVGKDTRGKE